VKRTWLTLSFITVPSGLLIGLGIVGWLKLHPVDSAVVSSNGGTRVLGTEASPIPVSTFGSQVPTPRPSGGLQVVRPESTTQTPGTLSLPPNGAQQSSGAQTGSSNGPTAADFKVYESYRDKTDSLYGDGSVGTGAEIVAGSKVTVAYRGWLTDGTLFDQTYDRNGSFNFTEGSHQVIQGWEDGLLGMKVGGKRRVIVPPSVGYGNTAHSGIPAGSVLVFDIELLAVK
jgi:FKBP-type peptidyl-prolyl cis-trans isomerase FkpA